MSYKIYPKILIYISLYIKINYKKMTTNSGEDKHHKIYLHDLRETKPFFKIL